jgi:DNA-binding transcriptional LysR family regulator
MEFPHNQTMNVPHLDIHLLRCFDALIMEAHVTRAAERMGMSQPAMSATLGKLRTLFGDPLLVRTERGMIATQRAMDALQPIRTAIDLIDTAIDAGSPFDASRSIAEIQIEASESVAFLVMPALVAHLRRTAPNLRLRIHPPELERVRQSLEEGDADLLISYLHPAPEGLRSTMLLRQKMCVIAAGDHPEIRGALSLDQYLRYPHARYSLGRTGSSTLENEIDAELGRLKLTRKIGITLPSALSSPAIVARCDMLATVPERVANHFAPLLGLQVLAPPIQLRDGEISMYWHDRMQNRPAHRWLRQCLVELARSALAPSVGVDSNS